MGPSCIASVGDSTGLHKGLESGFYWDELLIKLIILFLIVTTQYPYYDYHKTYYC